ncbi:MAG: glycosyltransferase family 4 protein [Bacteroidetes bacterium]|nr:glycosyltransferase family 4 protein [Bacteroidota bacterium]
MKNILIYFPYNQRTVEQQSVMEMLVQKGNKVHLLTLSKENALHQIVRKMGVAASASPVPGDGSFKHLFANASHLVKYCKENQIDVVLAHQQLCALPLIFASPRLKTVNYYIRHNTDEDYKQNRFKAYLLNRFINFWVKNIIAPSQAVYEFMIHKEHVNPVKIRRINYGYNFNQYPKPDPGMVDLIRNKFTCKLLILSIARLAPPKRHYLMFEAVKQLISNGVDVKMVCLGGGPLKNELAEWVEANKLGQNIFFEGVQPNVMDYLAAADLLLHLSETEASNSVVKESGLAKLPVIVCNDVGDFSDYIIDGENGFIVNKENPVTRSVEILLSCKDRKDELKKSGNNLFNTVTTGFDINNVAGLYDEILCNSKL